MTAFDADVRTAIEEGVAAGQQAIRAEQEHMGDFINGWQIARDLGRYGTKYTYRAAWTFYALGGNLVEDAVYPLTLVDSDGQKINGANSYQLHFAPGQTPPVDAFWSLTMYDQDSYLVDNPLNRYALGDRDPLNFGPDQLLTLYLQHDSPGVDDEANWLPTPAGEFKIALRLYRPKQEVADGTWEPPALKRVH